MNPSRLVVVIALVVLSCLGRAHAGRPSIVGGEVKWWMPEVDSKVKSSDDWVEGTSVSLEADLHLDSEQDVPYFKVWLGTRDRVSFSTFSIDLSGDDFPDLDVNFGGKTYTTAVELDTRLEAKIYRIAWERDWGDTGTYRLSSIVGVEVIEAEVSLDNSLVGSEKAEWSQPTPILGGQAEWRLPFGLGVYGELAGVYVGYGDFEGGFIEWEVGVKLDLMQGRFFATAGYRELKVDVEQDEDRVDLTLSGFVFGAGLSF